MPHPRFSKDEIAARGQEIYATQLRDQLEAENFGKYLVIDIETGDYEMDADDLTASFRAYDKKPDGARFGMQIGYPSSGTIGGTQEKAAA